MVKLRTEQDVCERIGQLVEESILTSNPKILGNFEEKEGEETTIFSVSHDFLEGAKWAVNENKEYIKMLTDKAEKYSKKCAELSEKINEYEMLYMGVEPISGRRGKKRKTIIQKDDFEDEYEQDYLNGEDSFCD